MLEDRAAQADRDEVVPEESDEPSQDVPPEVVERPLVPIAHLAPDGPVETVAAPDPRDPSVPADDRPVVPIAALAPAVPDAPIAAPDSTVEVSTGDERPLVPISFLAPSEPDVSPASPSDPSEQNVVPVSSLAPEADEGAPDENPSTGGEIYTQTLAELYAAQGATDRAIEVYLKLIADDPDDGALQTRLAALEALAPGRDKGRAELDVQSGLGPLIASQDGRQTVPIESLAPDINAG